MYCKTCGNKINSNAVVCPHCGCSTGVKKSGGESKKGMGVALGLFLGLIGLIIGVCLYESDSLERKTFTKRLAWLESAKGRVRTAGDHTKSYRPLAVFRLYSRASREP